MFELAIRHRHRHRLGDIDRLGHGGVCLLGWLRAEAPTVGPLRPGHPAARVRCKLRWHPEAVGRGSGVNRGADRLPRELARDQYGHQDTQLPSFTLEEIAVITASSLPDSPARTRPPR